MNLSDITPEVLNQVQSETRECKLVIEVSNIAGVNNNKQDQKEIALLFGVDEKCYSSLRRLL